ncbi:hypothetical protein IHQ71_00350 [Rhizobium sp. TH2]|uniref:hypothetical protein n=1 Tax=Rhizobium sp. TH2 TaxID=2775403 RepID=UPI002157D389|nr:hypothetical protein [Rhizobium sp. TH2]UVC09126.1 hypothetical protein IHQ71_00350 [Rhizobium sp. TH2]
MRTFIFAVVGLFILSGQAFAGWYQIENYEGFIGDKPVHFSLQKYDGFGSGITVEGVYFEDAKRSPIPVYGTVKGDSVRLCEISNEHEFQKILIIGSKTGVDTEQCPFLLKVDTLGATGARNDGAAWQPITLKKVAALDDTSDALMTGTVEIPFWAQTANQMFSGVYQKSASGICMTKLRVINKASGAVDQEIGFPDDPCDAGMVMTPIYLNVEKFIDQSTNGISIHHRDGGMGYSQTYEFDPLAKAFVKTE